MATAISATRHLKVAVIADAHLGSSHARPKELRNYLESIKPEILVIAGDLFDLNALNDGAFSLHQLAIVRRILNLSSEGTRVYYITGNHETALARRGNLRLGNLHVREEAVLSIEGHKYYIFHGDSLTAAVRYRLSNKHLEGSSHKLIGAIDRLRNRVRLSLGQPPWSLAGEIGRGEHEALHYEQTFRSLAIRSAQLKGCSRVICAHIHVPDIKRTLKPTGEETLYLNAGDWVSNLTALELRAGRWSVYDYNARDFSDHKSDGIPPASGVEREWIGANHGEVLQHILANGPTPVN